MGMPPSQIRESMVKIAAGELVSGYPERFPNRLWLRCSAVFNKLPEAGRSVAPAEGQPGPAPEGTLTGTKGGQGQPG